MVKIRGIRAVSCRIARKSSVSGSRLCCLRAKALAHHAFRLLDNEE
jgi:hypothetical protein